MHLKTFLTVTALLRGAIYRTGACAENWREWWRSN